MRSDVRTRDRLRQLTRLQAIKTAASGLQLTESRSDLADAQAHCDDREQTMLRRELEITQLLTRQSFDLTSLHIAQALHGSASRDHTAALKDVAQKQSTERVHNEAWQRDKHLEDHVGSLARKASRELAEKRADTVTEEANSLRNSANREKLA